VICDLSNLDNISEFPCNTEIEVDQKPKIGNIINTRGYVLYSFRMQKAKKGQIICCIQGTANFHENLHYFLFCRQEIDCTEISQLIGTMNRMLELQYSGSEWQQKKKTQFIHSNPLLRLDTSLRILSAFTV